ncbi:glycosyltransferase family 39 protein [Kitasatospora sp. NBC_01266]|uniref:glycosyltransferase family 39 protein n=1 Tax=Kitasatospora sp. NBC_01266 TaxID=2903572 RepID=UPI002E315591|nr:glycosyltransferase family 39 protein [Kitasatospora sp. NBC_01266]
MTTQLAGPHADEGAGAHRANRLGGAGVGRGFGGYRTRLLTSGRNAGPALLGYAAVRAIGVLIVLLWRHKHGESGLHRLSTMWDAYWYADIAQHGYAGSVPVPGPHGPYQAYAFFPSYPLLIRAGHLLLPLSISQAALLVAWFASLVAAWGIFAVGSHLYGRRVGTIAAVLWGVTPYSVVESLAYSELMFTAFTAWAMYAAVRRRWIVAGLLSTLAGLTRPTAVAVAGAVCLGAALALVSQWWRTRRGTMPSEERVAWWRPVVGGLIAPLGFVGFVLWVGVQKHSLTGYFKVQEAWQSQFDFGRSTVHSFRDILGTSNTLWMSDVVVAITLVASVMLFVLSILQRQPVVLVALSGLVLLLALGDASYFNSRARFLIPAFALLFPLAGALARVRTKGAVATVMTFAAVTSGLFGGYLAFVYTNSP